MVRRYNPDPTRMIAAVRLVLGMPETEDGRPLFIPAQKPRPSEVVAPDIPMARRVGLYCRVSGDEQREKQTIRTQIEFGQRMAELEQAGRVEVYPDADVPATMPFTERPEGSRLLQDLRDGTITEVWIYKLDRIGCSVRVILGAIDALEAAGAAVRFLEEDLDISTPAGRYRLTVMAANAELDAEG